MDEQKETVETRNNDDIRGIIRETIEEFVEERAVEDRAGLQGRTG